MNKKAQFELIGLAIVVMLVILGMFIAIKLQMLSKPSSIEREYGQIQLASNFLNTLLSTNTDCGERLVRTLLLDCADTRAIICVEDGTVKSSCQKADETIDLVLSPTLKKWNKKYLLTMRKGNQQIAGISEKSSDCTLEMEHAAPGIYHYTLEHGGTLTISLYLCY